VRPGARPANSPDFVHETYRFVFEIPNNEASLLPVASCLLVRSALTDANGKPIIRPYTPISPPDRKGELALLVKRYENGNQSKYIHSLKVSYSEIIITTDIIVTSF
jgi:cytochrome-b5 reductase